MDPISIALGLAQVVPTIVGWIAGDDAEEKAETIVNAAVAVTGAATGRKALDLIKAHPEAALKFQQAMMALERDFFMEETKRLEAVNKTIRAEVMSKDAYVRRMRPTFGYILAGTWALTMIAVAYTIFATPHYAGEIIGHIGELSTMWTVGLAVLGIYVWGRSSEKGAFMGPGGVFSAIAERIRVKKG